MNRNHKPEATYGSNGSVLGILAGGVSWLLPLDFNDQGRKRGGLFAATHFGSSAKKLGWKPHGPLRDATMIMQGAVGREVFTLKHPISGKYEDTPFSLDVKYLYEFVSKTSFGIVAEVTQTNELQAPIPSNFGLHPYFKCPDPEKTVEITGYDDWTNHIHVSPKDLEMLKKGLHEKMIENPKIDILIPGQGHIRMQPEGFSHLYVWRDRNDFICVEPTETSSALFGTSDGPTLLHGVTKVFKMYLDFHPEE